jgi:hypothetical protein
MPARADPKQQPLQLQRMTGLLLLCALLRTGKPIHWDAANLKAKNAPKRMPSSKNRIAGLEIA